MTLFVMNCISRDLESYLNVDQRTAITHKRHNRVTYHLTQRSNRTLYKTEENKFFHKLIAKIACNADTLTTPQQPVSCIVVYALAA